MKFYYKNNGIPERLFIQINEYSKIFEKYFAEDQYLSEEFNRQFNLYIPANTIYVFVGQAKLRPLEIAVARPYSYALKYRVCELVINSDRLNEYSLGIHLHELGHCVGLGTSPESDIILNKSTHLAQVQAVFHNFAKPNAKELHILDLDFLNKLGWILKPFAGQFFEHLCINGNWSIPYGISPVPMNVNILSNNKVLTAHKNDIRIFKADGTQTDRILTNE